MRNGSLIYLYYGHYQLWMKVKQQKIYWTRCEKGQISEWFSFVRNIILSSHKGSQYLILFLAESLRWKQRDRKWCTRQFRCAKLFLQGQMLLERYQMYSVIPKKTLTVRIRKSSSIFFQTWSDQFWFLNITSNRLICGDLYRICCFPVSLIILEFPFVAFFDTASRCCF
jgi:hypothetical protein